MKLLFALSFFTLLWGSARTQSTNFVVEVGAFAEPVSIDYFNKMNQVYETIGINNIYRYRINAKTSAIASEIQKEAIKKGYVHARVIDLQTLKEQCDIECGYTPPQPTGRGLIGLENANMYELSKKDKTEPSNNGSIDIENANIYGLSKKDKTSSSNNGSIGVENANIYELESNRGEIDIVDISKFEFKKGDKIECLFFDYDSYLLRDKSKVELNKLVWFLSKNKDHSLNIKSFTDAKGGDAYNKRLAQKRANITKKYLTNLGLSPSQISTEVYGEQKPIAINNTKDGQDSEEGRQYNRRIELTVYGADKQAIDIIKNIFVPEPLRPNSTK